MLLRQTQGFRMLGIGMDGPMILRGIQEMLQVVGIDRKVNTALDPEV